MSSRIPIWRLASIGRLLELGLHLFLTTAFVVATRADSEPIPPAPSTVAPSGRLDWNRTTRRVEADILGWSLDYTLERIATATGWEVYVEPGLEARISARIENRPVREALAILLADVNFALVPAALRATNRLPRLLVFRSSTSEATVAVRPPSPSPGKETRPISKELIVRLKKGGRAAIDELARKLGAKIIGAIDGLNAYRLQFDNDDATQAARQSLADNENVASVEDNHAITNPGLANRSGENGPTAAPLGIRARPITRDGSTVIVALLDSAVPPTGSVHADFLLPAVSVAGEAPAASASHISHGSAMFETVLQGLALTQKNPTGTPVRVLPIDIFGGQEETTLFQLAQGISTALDRGASVINLSLSGPNSSPLVQDLLRQGNNAGVMSFAAPGNEPTTAVTYPAAYPEVIAVTASDRRGQLANYANRGNFVDLIAPGTSIVPYAGDSWIVNGTSVSTAYASGLAAGLLSDTTRNSATIAAEMKKRLAFQLPAGSTPAPLPKP